jgi:hypothetical protein
MRYLLIAKYDAVAGVLNKFTIMVARRRKKVQSSSGKRKK